VFRLNILVQRIKKLEIQRNRPRVVPEYTATSPSGEEQLRSKCHIETFYIGNSSTTNLKVNIQL
jgi:hypothetical protein